QFVDAQTAPLFHRLITRFRELTGVPMVLNTSFNDREPLVATPDDALKTFSQTHIDALFLGDRLVRQTG
ncbi:MAG TPA: carbamoyltransferase C-terminal domain-containing protein, partial [Isosphaeraceae bacterium]|nr:carbamoyltransferase C-terminal domain-containing protein [Isosphaeraceae bacterium]